MINQFVLAGKLSNLFCLGNRYFIEVEVDEKIIKCELWEGVYGVLFEKPYNVPVAIKGFIKVEDGEQSLMAERVSVMSEVVDWNLCLRTTSTSNSS